MQTILQAFLENERGLKQFLRRFFVRTQDVEDIAQETFLKAFASESTQEIYAPKAYLFRIARNLALKEKAKRGNIETDFMGDFLDSAILQNEGELPVDDQLYALQRMKILEQAVATLPPQCARAFFLRKAHGMPYKDIAKALGISVRTVEKHVAIGLIKCREYLRRHGYGDEEMRTKPKQMPGVSTTIASGEEKVWLVSRRENSSNE